MASVWHVLKMQKALNMDRNQLKLVHKRSKEQIKEEIVNYVSMCTVKILKD